jgi:hypothetical protein
MAPEPIAARSYGFHGVRFSVAGNGAAPHLLHSRLAPFLDGSSMRPDVTVEFHCVSSVHAHSIGPPVGGGRPIYDPPRGEVLYCSDTDQIYINFDDRVRAICDAAHRRMSFSLLASGENAWMASHPLFTICWIEQLKRLGMFSIHASGVCHEGKGLLLAGASGSGKTTLAIALLRAGFGFLGDDMLFLRSGPEGIRALSFPDETDVTPETFGMFPELREGAASRATPGRLKMAVRAEAIYRAAVAEECEPTVLVFPRVVRGARPVLRPIGAAEALLELSSNVLLTDKRASQAHLDILGRLARQAFCYRIDAERPDAVATVLAELMRK